MHLEPFDNPLLAEALLILMSVLMLTATLIPVNGVEI